MPSSLPWRPHRMPAFVQLLPLRHVVQLHTSRRTAAAATLAAHPSTWTASAVWCARRSWCCGAALQSTSVCRAGASAPPPLSRDEVGALRGEGGVGEGRLLRLDNVDTFAQSRVKMYLQRMATALHPGGGGGSGAAAAAPGLLFGFEVPPRLLNAAERKAFAFLGEPALSKTWKMSFTLPVDVLVDGVLCRREVTAAGLATEAKLAVIAACMHAERCLDDLHVPLFTSDRRQRQRVEQARREGRTAPDVGAAPHELASVALFPAVWLPRATAAKAIQSAGRSQALPPAKPKAASPSGTAAGAPGPSGEGRLGRTRRSQPPPRRWQVVTPRHGADVFLRSTLSELAVLQASLFAHNREPDDDDEADGDLDGSDTVVIASDEIQILQPELLEVGGAAQHTSGGGCESSKSNSSQDPPRAAAGAPLLAFEPKDYAPSTKSVDSMIDESEGGMFDLVDGVQEMWQLEPKMPNLSVLYDPDALRRVSGYLLRTTGHDLYASVQMREAEEDTNEWKSNPYHVMVTPRKWYTARLDLAGIPVPAVGKATTAQVAQELCAMHAELLLQWFGIHVYDTASEQAAYYDACLRWGRLMAPEPVDPATVDLQTVKLPKPQKQWYRTFVRLRARRAERNVEEKLVQLHRRVVHTSRRHLVEVDIADNATYRELLSLAQPCLRSFLVAVRHPYEGAYLCYIFQTGSQYRVSIYLPLPERYGTRGGYCIASSPAKGKTLCALHSIDILCALDVVPVVCMKEPRWQRMMELREAHGMVLPPSYQYEKRRACAATAAALAALGPPPPPPSPNLRSPPAYREVPDGDINTVPLSHDVWRVMLLDTDLFDVAPQVRNAMENPSEADLARRLDMSKTFFDAFAQHYFGWGDVDAHMRGILHHYAGLQQVKHGISRVANNFWFELPLDPAVYGRRVALGRCTTRRGAYRMVYLHAMRIIRALGLAPWDTMETAELANKLYKGVASLAQSQRLQWKWYAAAMLDCTGGDGSESVQPAIVTQELARHAGQAGVSSGGTAQPLDMRAVPSPHPVMSFDLARRTFT